MQLKGSYGMITGAGRGIGKAIALKLAKEGANLSLLARTESELIETSNEVKKFGVKAYYTVGDISKQEDVDGFYKDTMTHFPNIDFLVNNAGMAYYGELLRISLEKVVEMMNVNFFGAYYLTMKVLPRMLARGTGHIINMVSMLGMVVEPGWVPYCASKHALRVLTEGLRAELRGTGVKVTGIYPGAVRTKLLESVGRLRPGILEPEDVAEAIVFVLKQPYGVEVGDVTILPKRT